jgi:hypothetical protein
MGIGIIGILDTPGTDLFLVPEDCLPLLHGILLVEDPVEKKAVFFLSLREGLSRPMPVPGPHLKGCAG